MEKFKLKGLVVLFYLFFAGNDTVAQGTVAHPGLEPFTDGLISTLLKENNIAGATFSLVENGQIRILKGYGFANVDEEIKVDPDSTLFRIASISKLFIWIGVMQMVEEGRLDLDRDINEYLEAFEIPATFPEPITLRALMTHTAGFEDQLYQLFVRNTDEKLPLEEVLRTQMPKRVRPPFVQASYSNHGTGLAQYLVELASGMPFIEYAEQYIFEPLGMHNTTLLQPLPDDMLPQLSNGYIFSGGKFAPKPFELVPLQSSGGASTTAADMARFMKSLLNNTCLDGNCLLDSATFAQMTKPSFFHADGVNPALLGFIDMSFNGHKIFGHGGNTFLFHSNLAILPEKNLGVFYSFNTGGAGRLSRMVLQYLVDHYYPDPRPLAETIELPSEYLQKFEGTYRTTRFSHTEIFKIFFLDGLVTITPVENKLKKVLGNTTTYWLPIDSLTFRNMNTNEIIAFSMDDKGKVQNLFLGNRPIIAYNKNYGIWNPLFHRILAGTLIVALFYILIVWPWMFFVRRKYVRADRAPLTLPFISKLIAYLTASCYLIFVVLMALSLPGRNELIFEMPGGVEIALLFPILAVPFTIAMIWRSILLIDERKTRIRSRLFYWISTLVFVLVIFQFHFWNLLGWNY
ncbi:MAG TPA: serine hydrolase domain-containing protein [Bacteroidales bacterium]|nr:serine hydrolase domain-containing protein [Bacteroidales bacterium]